MSGNRLSNNLLFPLIALVAGLLITAFLINSAFERLLEHEKDEFQTLTNQISDRLSSRLSTSEEALYNLSAFFNSSSIVDADEFSVFSNEILNRHPYIHSALYLPLITYERRGEFESRLHNNGYATFSISEFRNGRYITAPPRERYFPVLYQEPFNPYTASIMGYDVLSNNNMSTTIRTAIDSGNASSLYDIDPLTKRNYLTLIKALYSGKRTPSDAQVRRTIANSLLIIRVDMATLIEDFANKNKYELSVFTVNEETGQRQARIAHHKGNVLLDEDHWRLSLNMRAVPIELTSGKYLIEISSPVHWYDADTDAVYMRGLIGILLTLLLIVGTITLTLRTKKLQDTNKQISRMVDLRTDELQHEKTQLENEIKVRQLAEQRLLSQQNSMLKLSTDQVSANESLDDALKKITQMSAETLNVEYVSIWLFNKDHSQLECTDQYINSTQQHSSCTIIKHIDYPLYFATLEAGRPISADDARNDVRTSEFTETLLKPMNIYSMLGAPLRREGQIVGVLCHQHTDAIRAWKLDEQNYSSSIGDMISLEMERYGRKKAESKTIKLSRALEHAADSVFITDITGIIEYTNRSFETITGYKNAEVIGKNTSIISSGRHDKAFYKKLWSTILAGHEFRDIFINKKSDGTIYYEEKTITPLLDDNGKIYNFVSVGKDITERMQTQERLHFLAHHDLLTELPNRIMLIDRLNHAITTSQARTDSLAIMFLDLDRFKIINDTLGHNAGDQLLQLVADRLRPCVRKTDTVSRIGGDEFVILLEEIEDITNISTIAKNILDSLSHPFLLEGRELFITCSIGISIHPQDGQDSNALLKNADSAMYRAKEHGRNNFQYYSEDMNSRSLEKLTLETDLRHALHREQFELHYQPQVDLSTGNIIGFEALLRWQHPELGLVSPIDFIPILEDTGLILPVGEWVLRTACEQNRKWQKQGLPTLPVAVNLSARQFSDSNLGMQVSSILMETKLAPECLHLEITESVIMNNASGTYKILDELYRLGVHLAVDDFGTGYSSLSYLKRFPIHILKVDRSFVRDITTDPDDASIVSTVITLAHSLKLKVIAEGVETEDQAMFLRNRSCDIAQGYLYSKPISVEHMSKLLQDQSNAKNKIDELRS